MIIDLQTLKGELNENLTVEPVNPQFILNLSSKIDAIIMEYYTQAG